jgi:hypothetical protein
MPRVRFARKFQKFAVFIFFKFRSWFKFGPTQRIQTTRGKACTGQIPFWNEE